MSTNTVGTTEVKPVETEVTRSMKQESRNSGYGKFKITEHDIFLCYSPVMKKYLRSRGIKYLCSGRDIRNGTPFYAYYKNDELLDILHDWEIIKMGLTPDTQAD